jgi:hypothetical protein
VNPEFLKKIIDIRGISSSQRDIINQLYEDSLDFKSLNQFKSKLLEISNENLVSLDKFDSMYRQIFQDKQNKAFELLRNELSTPNGINIDKLGEIVDLFNFLPVKVKKEKNKSSDIYLVMSSGKHDSHSKKTDELDIILQSVLEIVWGKIYERF